MQRVLIADTLERGGIDALAAAGLAADLRPGLPPAELKAALPDYDAVIVRSAARITGAMLESPGRLRAIVRAGAGVDTIDVAAATRQGIVVMNTPGGNAIAAAEHTIALLLSLARQVPAAHARLKAGAWERSSFLGSQISGKTIGVIGLGRIGREVARRAHGLDMRVIVYDPFVTRDKAEELGFVPAASVAAMLPDVDYLTVHVPLTEETKCLIGAAELVAMKPTARVLNVARGGVIDEAALADALERGTIAGAAVDVFCTEPPPADLPLLRAPNVILTPHLGASTREAQETVAVEAARLVIDFLTRGIVSNAVNMAAVDRKELDELKLYVDLARRLGLLHAQMCQGAIRRVSLVYKGELASRKTALLTAAFTAGLLEYRVAGVNLVNAEVLARERGIEIASAASPRTDDFASLLQADVETDRKTYTAAGTLFGNQYLRLVRLGPYRLEAFLDGVLCIFTHRDQPGVIGHLGTLLGSHRVNIAAMNLGRQTRGGEAIGVLNLDSMPTDDAMAAMRQCSHVASVSVVNLPPAGELPGWLR